MKLNISKKINSKKIAKRKRFNLKEKISLVKRSVKSSIRSSSEEKSSQWNLVFSFVVFILVFGVLIIGIANLQIVKGSEMLEMSEENQIKIETVTPYRGVIFDKNGVVLAENVSSMNVYLSIEDFLNSDGSLNKEKLESVSNTLGGILKIEDITDSEGNEYGSIYDKVVSVYESSPYLTDILITTGINNDTAIKIKAVGDSLSGVYIDNGNKRYYPLKSIFSHILGYTSSVTAEDLEAKDYIGYTDVVGRAGLEYIYDEELFGVSGKIAKEVDSTGKEVGTQEAVLQEAVSGKSLYLTIDSKVQKKFYELLKQGVEDSGATGGAGIIEDVETGEILAIVTYPSYDNNLFIGGISVENYNTLTSDENLPLLSRAVSAQEPPGSTFKTIVASAALDAGEINRYTRYVSSASYTFSNGTPFQEYRGHAYGSLDLIDAISVSSNIYFCEVIRNWDMDELVPYIEKFGIGELTGIDLQGEMLGRVPSPENKEALANTTSPWLDPIWYPEGDSCNSVIGQGITLVTPIQMANWMAAIANGGTLNTPHVAEKFVSSEGVEEVLKYSPLRKNIVSESALAIVREGMYEAVSGSRGTIYPLKGAKVTVAAKTGTAEFGELNDEGEYEHTHAWTGGFFPYESPKYSYTVFLEDGGESANAAYVIRYMIDWMAEEWYVD
jgi:penicillin-binding protein 2